MQTAVPCTVSFGQSALVIITCNLSAWVSPATTMVAMEWAVGHSWSAGVLTGLAVYVDGKGDLIMLQCACYVHAVMIHTTCPSSHLQHSASCLDQAPVLQVPFRTRAGGYQKCGLVCDFVL